MVHQLCRCCIQSVFTLLSVCGKILQDIIRKVGLRGKLDKALKVTEFGRLRVRFSNNLEQLQYHQGSRLAAGPAFLCNLPQDLLYCITKRLSPCCQRNVFLTCPRLYSNWKIQLQEGDHKLQFLTWALQYLECSPSVIGYPDHTAMLQCFFPEQQIMEDIEAPAPVWGFKFGCRQRILTNNAGIASNGAEHWHAQSACQILHRITASPDSASVHLILATNSGSNQNRVSELAQIWFSSLVSNKGYLLFEMERTARGCVREQDDITVVHWGSEWTINGAVCKTTTPVLDFAHMPGTVCKVIAQLYSANSTEYLGDPCFLSVSDILGMHRPAIPTEAQYNFAYRKSVDHAAVVESMRKCLIRPHGMYRYCACNIRNGTLQRCGAANCELAPHADQYVSLVVRIMTAVRNLAIAY